MIQITIIYPAPAPNRVLDEEIQRLAVEAGGEFVGSGFTDSERDLAFDFPALTDAVSQGFMLHLQDRFPGLQAKTTYVVPPDLAICRKAIELLQQHESCAIDLLNEIAKHSDQLHHDEALEIIASLTMNVQTGLVPAWNGAISGLIAAMLVGESLE